MTPATIQVPGKLLDGLWLLLDALSGYELDETTTALCRALQHEVDVKYAAIERRESFTAYKTASAGSNEREQRRARYLDDATILSDWRSSTEIPGI